MSESPVLGGPCAGWLKGGTARRASHTDGDGRDGWPEGWGGLAASGRSLGGPEGAERTGGALQLRDRGIYSRDARFEDDAEINQWQSQCDGEAAGQKGQRIQDFSMESCKTRMPEANSRIHSTYTKNLDAAIRPHLSSAGAPHFTRDSAAKLSRKALAT